MTFVHNFHYQTFFTCCCIMFKDYLYVDCALMFNLAFLVEQILADLYQSFSDTCVANNVFGKDFNCSPGMIVLFFLF